jgi:hypothetical protein
MAAPNAPPAHASRQDGQDPPAADRIGKAAILSAKPILTFLT